MGLHRKVSRDGYGDGGAQRRRCAGTPYGGPARARRGGSGDAGPQAPAPGARSRNGSRGTGKGTPVLLTRHPPLDTRSPARLLPVCERVSAGRRRCRGAMPGSRERGRPVPECARALRHRPVAARAVVTGPGV
ncbi:hypothetical protein Ae168Ps1_0949 [Pseudonocardia sp. Ae168_Ps1]|nr:hypothetical protein Ae150APs1_0949 [Pseudonocardia sp. Ae150A_Ps1]OLL78543.1 hypothetical protein Ae168Ps1_0949 [Pseudonocardia sp. Ae168_Ps1]OLL87331.1 hypothetical protein Ae263Ps1_4386c [Pseudonocardia sp. Ae263_Ps1]OLL92639.1 hypothetical protein Ae356Ps1_2536 [Pseudonocardia sp. Ae356_Ps1]